MAEIKEAELRVEGQGPQAVFTVDLEVDWDHGDKDHQWQVVLRFKGADTFARGGDDALKLQTFAVDPDEGDRFSFTVDNRDGAFNEERGRDEIFAECELQVQQPEPRVRRTNKVKGNF